MTIAPPRRLRVVGLHHPRRLAHGVEHAGQVDADRLVPAVGIVDVDLAVGIAVALGRPEAVADVEPGVGEGDVAAAISRDMLVEHFGDLVELGDTSHTPKRAS